MPNGDNCCNVGCVGYWGRFLKSCWWLWALMLTTFLVAIIVAQTGETKEGRYCPCNGFDDFCCADVSGAICSECRCRPSGDNDFDNGFCKSYEESTELVGASKVVSIISVSLFGLSLLVIFCICYADHSEVSCDECTDACGTTCCVCSANQQTKDAEKAEPGSTENQKASSWTGAFMPEQGTTQSANKAMPVVAIERGDGASKEEDEAFLPNCLCS